MCWYQDDSVNWIKEKQISEATSSDPEDLFRLYQQTQTENNVRAKIPKACGESQAGRPGSHEVWFAFLKNLYLVSQQLT